MASRRPTVAVAALLAALALAGCSQSGNGDSDSGQTLSSTGSASAYVKDAPSDDFAEVHVLFTEVSVHRSAGSASLTTTGVGTATGTTTAVGNTTFSASASATVDANSSSSGSGSEGGWIVLFSDADGVDVDLLDTEGARAAFLGEEDLDAGHYQQIRMVVKEAWGIGHDGERVEITVSSGTLKSVKAFDVDADRETRITIDIDLEKSLKQQGNGQWRMTPVIGRTTSEVVDDSSSGEDSAEPGDIEDVPEAGDGTTVSASASVSASSSSTNSTSTGP